MSFAICARVKARTQVNNGGHFPLPTSSLTEGFCLAGREHRHCDNGVLR